MYISVLHFFLVHFESFLLKSLSQCSELLVLFDPMFAFARDNVENEDLLYDNTATVTLPLRYGVDLNIHG